MIARYLMMVEYKPYPPSFYHTAKLKSLTKFRVSPVRQRYRQLMELTNALNRLFHKSISFPTTWKSSRNTQTSGYRLFYSDMYVASTGNCLTGIRKSLFITAKEAFLPIKEVMLSMVSDLKITATSNAINLSLKYFRKSLIFCILKLTKFSFCDTIFIKKTHGSITVLDRVGIFICLYEKRILGKYIFMSQIGIFPVLKG